MEALEVLRLRQQVVLLKAQSLERDIIVLNYKQLMEEAHMLQQTIGKMEEEVLNEKHKAHPDMDPNWPYPSGLDPVIDSQG